MRDGGTGEDAEHGAEVIPEADAVLWAGLGEPEECVAATAGGTDQGVLV